MRNNDSDAKSIWSPFHCVSHRIDIEPHTISELYDTQTVRNRKNANDLLRFQQYTLWFDKRYWFRYVFQMGRKRKKQFQLSKPCAVCWPFKQLLFYFTATTFFFFVSASVNSGHFSLNSSLNAKSKHFHESSFSSIFLFCFRVHYVIMGTDNIKQKRFIAWYMTFFFTLNNSIHYIYFECIKQHTRKTRFRPGSDQIKFEKGKTHIFAPAKKIISEIVEKPWEEIFRWPPSSSRIRKRNATTRKRLTWTKINNWLIYLA